MYTVIMPIELQGCHNVGLLVYCKSLIGRIIPHCLKCIGSYMCT